MALPRYILLAFVLVLLACTPQRSTEPLPTAQTILEITPAPTQDVDATATAYAALLIPSPTPAGLYVVQPGDTLTSIADEFGTTVAELIAANGLTDPDNIQVGQQIIVPSLVNRTPVIAPPPTMALSPTPLPTDTPTPVPPTALPTETPIPTATPEPTPEPPTPTPNPLILPPTPTLSTP